MQNYSLYISALSDTFSNLSARERQRLDDLKSSFKSEEESLKNKFRDRVRRQREDLTKTLAKIEREITEVENKNRPGNAAEELRRLQEEELALRARYKELYDKASEKSMKRKSIRSRLFKFWWSEL